MDEIMKKLKEHDERFDRHDEKFVQIDKQLDLLVKKSIEHDERLEYIEEKVKKLDMFDDLMTGQDKMIAILERVDQERLFTHEVVKRLEADVTRIKQLLHLT